MKLTDLIRLLPTFEFPTEPERGYRIYIPLADLVDVFERNNLTVVSKRGEPK